MLTVLNASVMKYINGISTYYNVIIFCNYFKWNFWITNSIFVTF